MKRLGNLDELQLLRRGNVFKHGLFCLVGLLLFNTLLYSYGIEWASGKWAELTIILFVVVLCSIEFIYFDIYPLTERMQRKLIYFTGLLGMISIITCMYDFIFENADIAINGRITESTLGIIYGVFFLSIFFAYILKLKYSALYEIEE